MSNRNSMYGDATHTDPFQASQRHPDSRPADEGERATDEARQKGQHVADDMLHKGEQAKEKVDEASHMAQERADQGMHKAAEGLDQAAGMIRERGSQQGGSMGSMASSAANTLDQASGYLRDKDSDQLMDDIEAYIRQNPTQSLLIAAGVGFVLSKVFK